MCDIIHNRRCFKSEKPGLVASGSLLVWISEVDVRVVVVRFLNNVMGRGGTCGFVITNLIFERM